MVIIRPIKRTEIEEAFKILKACFLNVTSTPEQRGVILVAEVDGKLVGTLSMTVTKTFSYLDDLAVLPEYRQQGIATKLMTEMLKIAEQNSDETYGICASQWSARICKRLGFKKEEHGRYVKKALKSS